MRVTIGRTATTSDWRELRGSACVAQAPKSFRPPLQAEPFAGIPYRVFPSPVHTCEHALAAQHTGAGAAAASYSSMFKGDSTILLNTARNLAPVAPSMTR